MVPNVYTGILLSELEYQERLRAAKERLAASTQQRTPSPRARLRMVTRVTTGWLAVRRLVHTRLEPSIRIASLGTDPSAAEGATA